MDAATGYCEGCMRTLAEIVQWSAFTSAERRRIMAALPDRRARLARIAER
jgi:hypothetical protein